MSFLRFSPWKSRSALRPPPPLALSRRWIAAVLRHKALHAGPGLDQRAIDRKVVAGEQPLTCGRFSTLIKELGCDIAVEQPIPVLAEHGCIPYRIVDRQSDEPAEQQIVVELLHQLPLRAHRVEGLQQQRPQQSFRRDRWPAVPRIKLVKFPRQLPSAPHRPACGSRAADDPLRR